MGRIHLEEPIVQREEEGLAEEVGDGSLGEGDGPDAAPAEEVGEQVAGVVKQVPLLRPGRRRLLLLVDTGGLAPASMPQGHRSIDHSTNDYSANTHPREFSSRLELQLVRAVA